VADVLIAVEERVRSCCGHDWPQVAAKLAEEFHWEYEGYR